MPPARADVLRFRFVVFYDPLFFCKALAEVRSIYGVIAGFLMSYLDFIQCAAVALSVMQTFAYIAFYASVIHLRHLLAIVLSSSLPKNIRAHLKMSACYCRLFFHKKQGISQLPPLWRNPLTPRLCFYGIPAILS